jgi:hypothetical protein
MGIASMFDSLFDSTADVHKTGAFRYVVEFEDGPKKPQQGS